MQIDVEKSIKIHIVTLNSIQGPIERVLVEEVADILVVCRLDEFEVARATGRPPAQ